MLTLTIITTVLEAFILAKCVKNFEQVAKDEEHPIAALIGEIIGTAINCIPLITVWVLYNHLA